jgi:pilus assembly protein Flp/PilA
MDEPSCGRRGRGAAPARILGGLGARTIVEGRRFGRDTRGSTALEYALIGFLIFVVAVTSIRAYATRVSSVYDRINTAVTQAN